MDSQIDYEKIDSIVIYIANLINIIMAILFLVRIFNIPQVERVLGIIAMIMGFFLGFIAIINKISKRSNWEVYLLVPIFLVFLIELILEYILVFDFRSTIIVGPYILLYYIGLWALIGYSFRFDKKWGFVTLATYFLNMIFSLLQFFISEV
jgi:hypothetical protein